MCVGVLEDGLHVVSVHVVCWYQCVSVSGAYRGMH